MSSQHLAAIASTIMGDLLLPVVVAMLVPILLAAILFHLLPNLSRRDIFFAVTVDPAFRQTADSQNIIRRFRTAVWIHSVIALAIVCALLAFGKPLLALAGIFWQMGFILHAYLRGRKQALAHAVAARVTRREATLVPRRMGGVGMALLQIGPFAILAASAIYIRTIWYRIPERFPIQWGLDGRPSGWAMRSFIGIYGLCLIGFVICAFIEIFAYGVVHWSRKIRSIGTDAQNEAHFRRVQVGVLIALEYFFALVFNGIPFNALRPHPEQAPSIIPFLLGTLAFIGVLVAIMIHAGQGGANLARAGKESDIIQQRPVGDGTPDDCWRAGMFYVNPDDPAVLVEKRFGIGYTLNFARPVAWVLMAFILALVTVPLVIAFISTHAR